jgi:hypothetical protein
MKPATEVRDGFLEGWFVPEEPATEGTGREGISKILTGRMAFYIEVFTMYVSVHGKVLVSLGPEMDRLSTARV